MFCYKSSPFLHFIMSLHDFQLARCFVFWWIDINTNSCKRLHDVTHSELILGSNLPDSRPDTQLEDPVKTQKSVSETSGLCVSEVAFIQETWRCLPEVQQDRGDQLDLSCLSLPVDSRILSISVEHNNKWCQIPELKTLRFTHRKSNFAEFSWQPVSTGDSLSTHRETRTELLQKHARF